MSPLSDKRAVADASSTPSSLAIATAASADPSHDTEQEHT